MTTFLLDTNIVSYLLRRAPPSLVERLGATARDDVAISIVTAMELQFGVEKNPESTRTREAVGSFLSVMPVLTFPEEMPSVYGRVRADLERRGKPIGPLDTMIAAHALAVGATLVTNNTREFRRVRGLQVEDWTKPRRRRTARSTG
jgi:tRNA(fMet)-specific endonuclease VapC